MGNESSVCKNVGLKRQVTVLVVGLDNSGKTCTSRALVGETITDTVPTIGFSKLVTRHKGITISIYDLGGSTRIREIWQNYFAEAHGVVYVIDASDTQRIQEAQTNLSSLMKNPKLRGKPLLLLANKQDHFDALDEVDVADKLQLEILANECQTPTRIEICCATQGTGKNIDPIIRIGFHWLIESILRNFDKLQRRITDDVIAQKQKEEKEKEARRERIEKLKALQNGMVADPDATIVPTETKTSEVVNETNTFQPLEKMKEEWNLPGSVLESAPFVHLEASVEVAQKIAQTKLDQIEDFIQEEKDTCVAIINDVRETISAPILPVDQPVNSKASSSRSVPSSSSIPLHKPTSKNGKQLPPLKKAGSQSHR